MKLCKAQNCLEKLNEVFDRTTQDFNLAEGLCDILLEVEKQAAKYGKLRYQILKEHYNVETDGTYKIKPNQDINSVQEKFNKLDELEFKIEKRAVSKLEFISPRELCYLKEFFDFI